MARKKSEQRGRHGYQRRIVGRRELAQSFLIVCEGSKTEPEYFEAFQVPRDVVRVQVIGRGGDPIQIVDAAVKHQKQAQKNGIPFDQVWCVFDRDDVNEDRFNQALSDAARRGFRVAYTNQAFELWYLLHFDYHNTGIDRSTYKLRLTAKLGYTYRKNDPGMYATLAGRQKTAISFAVKLLDEYDPADPANDNPSTTVHLLVQELNKYAQCR